MSKRMTLYEKYKPRKIQDFIGIPRVKAAVMDFLSEPYSAAFLFVGPPGLGKSSLAWFMAEYLNVKPIHLAGAEINWEALGAIYDEVSSYGVTLWSTHDQERAGPRFHFVLFDEVDAATKHSQERLLKFVENKEPRVVWVFTSNTLKVKTTDSGSGVESRLKGRCKVHEFNNQGMSEGLLGLLERVWFAEGGTEEGKPDFYRLINRADSGDEKHQSNPREALSRLEEELSVARGSGLLSEGDTQNK